MPPVSASTPPRLSVGRRAVTRGAAWTAPLLAVSVAAPAFAASCVSPYRLDWGTTPYGKTVSMGVQTGTAQVPATSGSGTPVTVTFTSQVQGLLGGTPTRHAENLTVAGALDVGGLGAAEGGLSLRHEAGHGVGVDNRQTVVISFSRPVTGLSFTIADIDSSGGLIGFWDQIELNGARTFLPNPDIIGQGVALNPWRYKNATTPVDDDASGGNITVTYAGIVSGSITLLFYSATANAAHRVFLTDFTFTADCT